MADLNKLIQQRGKVKGSLTRFANFLNKGNYSTTELKSRLDKIDNLWEEFDVVQSEIEILDPDQPDQEIEREEFENSFFKYTALAKEHTAGPTPASTIKITYNDAFDSHTNIKLPTVNLPAFSGDYQDWLSFFQTFNALIHEDINLNNIQKMHYLKSSLSGVAKQSIDSLAITHDNYPIAYDMLVKRFHDKKLIIKTHVNALFQLPTVYKNNPQTLRQLVDTVHLNIKVLASMGIPTDSWDVLIIHMILNKLDDITIRDWENHNKDDIPTLSDFMEFLKNKCQVMESLQFESVLQLKANKPPHTRIANFTFTNKNKCLYCKQNHWLYLCEGFKGLSVEDKFNEAKRLKLCINCLGNNHTTFQCRSSSCKFCNKRHHSLLHRNSNSQQGENNNKVEQNTTSCHSTENIATQVYTFLSTCTIHVVDNTNKTHVIRALLDPGSQSNFITHSTAMKLSLPIKNINYQIKGINESISSVNRVTKVVIKSKFNEYSRFIDCIVLNKITENIPNITLDKDAFNIPHTIKLADPHFYKSAPIDLLLGADVFWDILCIGQIKRKQLPILQKTIFGWIVGGSMYCNINNKNLSSFISLQDLDKSIKRFWEIEEIKQENLYTDKEVQCENHFKSTYTRDSNGRFVVRLPFNESHSKLGLSKIFAERRFTNLEKRFQSQPRLKGHYVDFIDEYLSLQHMSLSKNNNPIKDSEEQYFLPHHAVYNLKKSPDKIRVVFDGSAKTTTGVSLNDKLLTGPALQQDLFAILLRFRTYK